MAAICQIIKNTWDMINASNQYMGLFLIAVLFLFIVDSEKNRLLFSYCLLSLLFVLNPFTANNFMSFFISADEYWCVFLLTPIICICSYCFVEAVSMQKMRKEKMIVFIALILIAWIAGQGMNRTSALQQCENRAYIQDEYLALIKGMDVDGEPIVLLANDDIMECARAYSSNIGLPYEVPLINQEAEVVEQFYDSRLVLVHEQMQQPAGFLGNIATTAREYQCNYLIIPVEADERWEMTNSGYEVLLETEGYVLYHDDNA